MPISLIPDRVFQKYSDITPEFLAAEGVSALLIDIDNTLAPYEQAEPDSKNLLWLKSLSDSGISVALVSNNSRERVERFASGLAVPAYAGCGKPRTKRLLAALAELGAAPNKAAILGDQIFTDCLAARRAGMKAYIVPPIKDKKTLFFRLKRLLERPVMKKYQRNSSTERES